MADIAILWKNQVVEKTTLLEETRSNSTKEQEVIKELAKKDGIVYVDRKIYMPDNQKIRENILQENHKLADIKHPEQYQMMELIKRNYWWPGIKNDVKNYV